MTTLGQVAARPRPTSRIVRGRSWSGLTDALCVAAAAAPFVVVALIYVSAGHLIVGGDQALVALDALDARHLDQGVGSYSRMGWAHPGPMWAYLTAPLWWAFGSTGQGLIAASLLLHGLAAALTVLAAGGERAWQRPLTAAVILLYVTRMPAVDFVNIWNPFALLLPTMLLLIVAGRACAGSVPHVVITLLVASFLVQTHIGTAPLVALVGSFTLVVTVVRARRGTLLHLGRRAWLVTGAAAFAFFLVWLPPLLQQLRPPTPGRGNISLLVAYFRGSSGVVVEHHTWAEALSATGQMLGAPVYGWLAEPRALDTSVVSAAVLCAVSATVIGGLAVAALARHWREPGYAWVGLLTTIAGIAGLVAARTVTGEMQNYLLLWVTTVPAVLLYAGVALLLSRQPRRSGLTSTATVALVVVTMLLAALAGAALQRSASTRLSDQPGAAEAAGLALDALGPARASDPPVLLDITDVATWTTATSLALDLSLAGHRVSVEPQWVYSFGEDRRTSGDERWRLALVPVTRGQASPAGQLGIVAAINGPTAVVLTRLD